MVARAIGNNWVTIFARMVLRMPESVENPRKDWEFSKKCPLTPGGGAHMVPRLGSP